MKSDKIFTRDVDGQIIEIGNWQARQSASDAFLGMPLSDSRIARLQAGQKEGKTDRQIYTEMHPVGEEITYSLSLDALHTEQLCQIANQLLDHDLTSLHRLRKDDLVTIIRTLITLKKTRIGIKVQLRS